VAIWHRYKRGLCTFSVRVRINGYLAAAGQKSEPDVGSGHLDFLSDRCISTTDWRLLDIFDVFVLLRRMSLWPWPLTFWDTNFCYPTTTGYWITITENLITFRLYETVTAHARCHVTYNRGKNSQRFWNLWPQFTYSLCHFPRVTTMIKPCYWRK